MLKRNIGIILVVAMIVAMLPTMTFAADETNGVTFVVKANADAGLGGDVNITFTQSGTSYSGMLYLPGSANTDNLKISWNGDYSVTINGTSYTSGETPIPAKGASITYKVNGTNYTVTTMQGSSGVKGLFFNIDESQGTIADMNNDTNHETVCKGTATHDGNTYYMSMKGRGNTTWTKFDKKPYNITFFNTSDYEGDKKKVELIDGVKSKKWSILANAKDPTCLRNKIGYDIANTMGIGLASESIDVWMNGEYLGNYLLTPKNDYQVPDEGYLLEIDNLPDTDQFTLDGVKFTVKNMPETLTVNDAKNTFSPAWTAVKNSSSEAYLDYFDLDSWAKMYLLNELYKDVDVVAGSIFFMKKNATDDSKWVAGPVWDLDGSMGRVSTSWGGMDHTYEKTGQGWYVDALTVTSIFKYLGKHASFMKRVYEMYNEYKAEFNNILNNLDTQAALITDSANMNYARWPQYMTGTEHYSITDTTKTYGSGSYAVTYKKTDSWDNYIYNFKEYLTKRLSFFSDNLTVTAPTAVSITGETNLFINDTLTLTADTTAGSFQWQSSEDGTSWTNISGATSKTYSVKATSDMNGLQYRCVATNTAASTINTSRVAKVAPAAATANGPVTVTVSAKLTGISVKTLPDKTEYLEGKETLDVTGGEITLAYDDETTKDIDMTADMVTGFDNTKVGTQQLTVTYEGKTTTFNVTIKAKSLTGISIKSKPTKLEYMEGKDALDVTGGVITLAYDNGTSEDKDMTTSMITGFDNTKPGTQTLTVTYGGKTTTFDVTIKAKTLTGISIKSKPTKLEYLEGKDALNVTGGVITLAYDNGTSEDKNMTTSMITGFDNTKVGTQTLTVTYGGKTANFDVTIKAKSLTGISIKSKPNKLEYLEGKDALDVTGGVITLAYDNDASEDKDMTASMISGFDNTKTGTQTLTVTYNGKKATFDVTIKAKTLTGISIKSKPTKLEYLEGKDALDVTGGVITLAYDNGTSEDKDMTTSMISGFDNTKVGTQTLTVTYSGKKATFDVTIKAKTLTGITIKSKPLKLEYIVGKDALDVTGGVITLAYDNGTSEDKNMTTSMITGFDNTKIGKQTLTVTYSGKKATFDVTIKDKSLTGITIKSKPTKLEYLEGKDALDVTGGVITLAYDNDTSEDKDMTTSMISGFDNTKVGTQTLTVTYSGKKATFDITIKAKTLTGISIKNKPEKLEYLEGKDALDVTGGEITLAYDNGTSEDKDMTASMISGFDNTKVGTQKLTVTYEGKTTAFNVNIKAKSLTGISIKSKPEKLEYLEGKDALDVSGGVITLAYDNDTSEDKDITASMISGFDNTKVGTQTLTVTYGEKKTTFDVTIKAKTLTGIKMKANPKKLEYLVGKDTLDVTGGVISLEYDNDTTEDKDITLDMVTGFDNTKTGKQTLTVTYSGKSTTFDVTVLEKTLTGISIKSKPEKLEYLEGKDALDVSGGVITLAYDNGTTEDKDMTAAMISGFDNTKVGVQTLTVSYNGKTATFDVTIKAKSLEGISVKSKPDKLEYLEGKDALDVSGGVITLEYDNDTTEDKDMTASMISGFDNTKVGTQTLTVTYSGKETTFDITIKAKSLTGISVKSRPEKIEYLEGKDSLDVTGGKITLTYDNGTSEDKDMTASMISGFDNTKVGTQTLTVTYGGKKATFDITIKAKTLTGISIKSKPTKLEYLEGKDALDVTGGVITLAYDNGTSEDKDMTASMISGFDNTKVGTQTLTVTYGGKKETFDVTIKAKTLTGISIKSKPTKLEYLVGKDSLNVAGGVITLAYDNGTSEDKNMTTSMISGFDNTKTGTQTLTVTYSGKKATFDVTVVEKTLTGISIKSKPEKLEYLEGKDALSVTGGVITLAYDNGTSEDKDMTASMISGFDNTKVGTQTLTVTYSGKKATFDVTIKAKSLTGISIKSKPTKLEYLEGKDTLNVAGGVITVAYDNGTSEDKNMTASMISGFDNTKVGTQTLTVTYNGKKTTFDITIKAKTLTGISVKSKPTKIEYLEGKDALDVTGGVITLAYDNGTSENKNMTTSMISGFDNTKTGKQTLTVTYSGKKATFDVTIKAKSLTGISIKSKPTKLEYLEGKDALDVSDGVITVAYDNGTSEDKNMTASMISGFDNTKVGTQTLTVTYNGKKTTFDITIKAKTLTGISVKSKPTKIEYLVGKESLDVTGGVISLAYDNGTSENKNMTTSMVSGFDNTKLGKQTLTVTYGGKKATFDVHVVTKRLVGIAIKSKPTKLTYHVGKDDLDVTGGKITLTYEDGTMEDKDMTLDMVSGFDKTKSGPQIITITYNGKTTTLEVIGIIPTGDSNNAWLYAMLGILAILGGAGAAFAYSRKRCK